MKSFQTLLAIFALLPSVAMAFGVHPVQSTLNTNALSTTTTLSMAKGFGKEEAKPQKVQTEGAKTRADAGDRYDSIAAAGDDESWFPCGSIAVKRGEQVSNAIFGNELALQEAIVRTYPKLKGFEAEFEYGYNMKIYPDEPVEIAVKGNASSGPSIGNWMSNLLSPVDASQVGKS
ncbi:MAG: hypothetical protein SGARI_004969 [Bacillariaceae sp.]